LELRDVFIDVSTSHLKFLKLVLSLLLLGIVYEGSLEIFFKYCPRGSPIEFLWVIFHCVQPVIVPLDPSSSFLSSNVSHKVGALLVRVSGYSGVSVHNHEPLKGDQEIHGLASISFKVFRRVSFESRAFSSTIIVSVILIFSSWVPIGVRRISSSTLGCVRTEGIIIVVPIRGTTIP